MTVEEMFSLCKCEWVTYRVPVAGHFVGDGHVVTYRIGSYGHYVSSCEMQAGKPGEVYFTGQDIPTTSLEAAMAAHMKMVAELSNG